MAIHSSGLFLHRAVVRRDQEGVWRGRASPNPNGAGLVGDAPDIRVTDGRLTLELTQSLGSSRVSRVSLSVGPGFEAVLRDDDVVDVMRGDTGDLAATLSREGELVMAIGAIKGMLGRAGIAIEADPRTAEQDFPGLARTLARPDAMLVWLDPASANLEAQLAEISRVPRAINSLLIVVRSDDRDAALELNRRAMEHGLTKASRWFEVVPARFATRDDWIAYINQLSTPWPPDPFLGFVIGDRRYDVRAGEYQYHESWHFYVNNVSQNGDPGRWANLGLARADAALTVEDFVSSVRRIANGPMDFHGAFGQRA